MLNSFHNYALVSLVLLRMKKKEKSKHVAKYTRLKPGELQRLSFSVGAL